MEVGFSILVSSGTSTEQEVRVWYVYTAGEVEWMESTIVRYLMQWMLSRLYTLECTQQTLVSHWVVYLLYGQYNYTVVYTVPIMQVVFSDIVLENHQRPQTVISSSWICTKHVYSNDNLATYQSFNKCLAFYLVVKDFNTSFCACLWCTLALGLVTKVSGVPSSTIQWSDLLTPF